ncbi:hypothetical protein R3P38DRAFT_2878639 [Favolaschia claudopus]|uniref:Uncharacterized protein n=1 Tax=Favolaschia claudopus TaxID=2862362 RepID=A0AAW0D0T5_9AGAR
MVQSTFRILSLAALATSFIQSVTAIPAPLPAVTTLAVPGPSFFPTGTTPIPATMLGVDSEGRTKYLVEEDFFIAAESDGSKIPFIYTIVEGKDHVAVAISPPSQLGPSASALSYGCDMNQKNGQAVCSGFNPMATRTASVAGLVIDVVSTAAPSPNSAASMRKGSMYLMIAGFAMVLSSAL